MGKGATESAGAITALVLAGGRGTRLRSVVDDRPKPLADVAGRPFLAHLFDQLEAGGVRDVVVCTGYRGEQIEREFGASYGALSLRYSREDEPLGTAGALRHAMRLVTTDDVLVLNGDSHCAIELDRFVAWFRSRGARCGITALDTEDVARYGQMRLDAAATVFAFEEKGRSRSRGWINAGIYGFRSDFLRSLPAKPLSLEHDVLPELAEEGIPAWRTDAAFIDIGTPDALRAAQRRLGGARAGLLILDRDGTVIRERHYLSDPAAVELLPGVTAGLRDMKARGYDIAIVTNQSGIGRGMYGETDYDAVNARMLELLAHEGVEVDGVWHCPHAPDDACGCRKPNPGMFDAATESLGYAASECIVVGDKACDIDLGARAGARTVLVRTGYGAETEARGTCAPDVVVDGIDELARAEAAR